MAKRSAKLAHLLRKRLDDVAPDAFQTRDPVTNQLTKHTYAEVWVDKVMEAAACGKEWALQMVGDRAEGKPVAAEKVDQSDKTVDERLDDVTLQHLNALTGIAEQHPKPVERASTEPASQPTDVPRPADPVDKPSPVSDPAPARRLLDLPSNKARSPKGQASKP